ncbi:hypothetical protein N473_24845 [Pseudoalteromonas luteoviolacea CPMOR-1]|uniref:Uncharacterized protein n=1 Tax=Pseudoalteromonas luteoviolacea CPMOR-1 TaxID=1365248 RepID=A0A167IXP0_9GAMM|nr:hypothetical protein N473_24845 [Pseudoalteromonas luteoviolacea CPMOR-1]
MTFWQKQGQITSLTSRHKLARLELSEQSFGGFIPNNMLHLILGGIFAFFIDRGITYR